MIRMLRMLALMPKVSVKRVFSMAKWSDGAHRITFVSVKGVFSMANGPVGPIGLLECNRANSQWPPKTLCKGAIV